MIEIKKYLLRIDLTARGKNKKEKKYEIMKQRMKPRWNSNFDLQNDERTYQTF